VAVLGCGTVGGALVRLLLEDPEGLADRAGVGLELVGVAVADPTRDRPGVPRALLTGDAAQLVADPTVEVVVELIGGLSPARELVEEALTRGKAVVTANKALVASCGPDLAEKAAAAGVDLLYEAAVAGAIPIIRPLRESLAGERVQRVAGIVNGTTNFVLTRMAEAGEPYEAALAEAQRLGYAERDPTADVGGHDAAQKAAILAGLAFRCAVRDQDVSREGIEGLQAADVAAARRLGFEVKLLAVAEMVDGGAVSVRVHPALVPQEHPLAAVRGAFNAVFVEGQACGELMLYGRGAGGAPTASAVLGDLIDAAWNRLSGTAAPAPVLGPARIQPLAELRCPFYLSLEVADRPGVLAAVASVFGRHGVSIRSMEQDGQGDEARLIFLTHSARDGDVQATLAELARLDAVRHIGAAIRVAGVEEAEEPGEADRGANRAGGPRREGPVGGAPRAGDRRRARVGWARGSE
jgi:homoserine dehydrogenase